MKALFLTLILTISTSYADDECRYSINKQGDKWYLLNVVDGELPQEKDKVGDSLELGISDIKYEDKEGNKKETRIRVRQEYDSEKEAREDLSSICD
jgi:hypothetical protein